MNRPGISFKCDKINWHLCLTLNSEIFVWSRNLLRSKKSENQGVFIYERKEKSEQISPASMLQVALVPPYREVDKAVKPIPKSDGKARRYATEVI